jgi:hypothetical protein
MEIDAIRTSIRKGNFFITDHALSEGFKDGISGADMLHVIQTGKIIERYPDRRRCLIYGRNADTIPIHVVVDFSAVQSVTSMGLQGVTHIWIFHEHPDHLHFPTLKAIPAEQKSQITLLYQEHFSSRMCRALGNLV